MSHPRPPRTLVDRDGITFVFTHDRDDVSLLHIFARHLTTIDDALRVWFDEAADDFWNERYSRWESTSQPDTRPVLDLADPRTARAHHHLLYEGQLRMTTDTGTTSRAGRRTTGYDGSYQVVADVELSAVEEAEIDRQMAQLEADPEPSVSTALRWGRAQLDVVRRAARLSGVPYQTYLKEAAFRCAITDLRAAREAGVEIP